MPNFVRTVVSLALLYAFRMLGLFMVLPVLMIYGERYAEASPFLLGLALGIYGLTQAIFQIPLGMLSDMFGRKPIIVLGLLVFAAGSLLAALSDHVYGLILGRALQGSGAIASVILALVADLTSDENRTKAMAAIGASIGVAFSVAMVLGPLLAAGAGLGSIFYLATVLALVGIAILLWLVPAPQHQQTPTRDAGAIPALFKNILRNPELLRLNWGIFALHFILMASFVGVPLILEEQLGLDRERHWQVYLPVLLGAFVTMLPLVVLAEKKRRLKGVFLLAIAVIACVELALSASIQSTWVVLGAIFLFFVGFNLLEASLPSWVSKVSPAGSKGTAMGVYSTSQFFGAFLGGACGGWLVQQASLSALFTVCAALAVLWFVVALSMQAPKYLQSMVVSVHKHFNDLSDITALPGVEEAVYVAEERRLYLKVNKERFDRSRLTPIITE